MRESRVLGKLIALVLIAAATAAGLLAVRQRRVDAAHDLARVQAAIAEHDQALWRLRLDIAARVRPEDVRELASRLGGLTPILKQNCPPPAPDRQIAAAGAPPAGRPTGRVQ